MTRRQRGRTEWWSPVALRLHATLIVGLVGCAVASRIEWGRALGGHTVAWVYAFEWPVFAVAGAWVWWRLVHVSEKDGAAADAAESVAHDDPEPARGRRGDAPPSNDPQLLAWQDYLARLNAADPPGGPPQS